MSKVVNAFALGILVLAVAVFIPTLINATQEDQMETMEIRDNQTVSVTDRLSIGVADINLTAGDANVTATNSDTLNSQTQRVSEGSEAMMEMDGGNVTVGVDTLTADARGEYAQLTVAYSPMFGWDSGARLFVEHWPVLLAAIGFLIVVALVFKGVNP